MNNFMISLKRFFTNKNTVTIIGVIIVLGILYWGYSSTINKAVNPVNIPIAANTIDPQTEVTAENIEWIEVPSISANDNVLTNESQIVGKYTDVHATIPKGSMFYADALVEKEELPGSWLTLLESDEIPLYFNVNLESTYANSIQPEDYIDVYMSAEDESGMIMYGKLIENLKITAVKDSAGKDVFKSADTTGEPAYLYFGVTEEFYYVLKKATLLNSIGIQIVVVPHGGAEPITGDIEVSSEYLRDYIDAHTVAIPENEPDVIDDGNAENSDEDNNNTTNNNANNNNTNTNGNE